MLVDWAGREFYAEFSLTHTHIDTIFTDINYISALTRGAKIFAHYYINNCKQNPKNK